ncbi:MAG: hypothetical protein KJZ91_29915 [Myxococcales bacterium]|nr:hypothetical protein [Myxococcales bacterium]
MPSLRPRRSSRPPRPAARATLGLVAGALASLGAACVEPAPPMVAGEAPLVGVDGSRDQADRDCHVVLRDLARVGNGTGGWQEQAGVWIWEGAVEISEAAAAAGAVPAVLFQYGSDPTWWEVAAIPDAGAATPGFVRHRVRLDHHLPGPGLSGTALTRARVEVVPFVRLPAGGRLFDHNRHPGDFDNHELTLATGFAVPRNDAVCPAATPAPPARLVFAADGGVTQHGGLVPGGQLRVEYDPARLTTCRNSRNGQDLWDLTAHARWDTGLGASASIKHGAVVLDVPRAARRLELWFENTAIPGCQAWDSRGGANYGFDVLVAPAWIGQARIRISRDSGDACDGGVDAGGGFTFDTWARQRAAVTNVCLQAWSPGVTDRDDPAVWQQLDTTLRWRPRGASTPLRSIYADFDRRVGNDARFAASLRAIDPFRAYHCPDVPTSRTADGQYVRAEIEYVLVVNGVELRPAPGAYFTGAFEDHAADPFRAANCP